MIIVLLYVMQRMELCCKIKDKGKGEGEERGKGRESRRGEGGGCSNTPIETDLSFSSIDL